MGTEHAHAVVVYLINLSACNRNIHIYIYPHIQRQFLISKHQICCCRSFVTDVSHMGRLFRSLGPDMPADSVRTSLYSLETNSDQSDSAEKV